MMETVPVTILTGFLGSGKTTLLNRLLRQPELDGTVVIINEWGEIGLDHLLVEVSEENFALLDNGCVCCTVRGDLVGTLKDIARRAEGGRMAPPRRVLLETTGLADPAPILHTLMAEPEILSRFHLGAVVATVDAVNGYSTLERHAEAARQVAVADRILVTKVDIAGERERQDLDRMLARIAPAAPRREASMGEVAAAFVLDAPLTTEARAAALADWFEEAGEAVAAHQLAHDGPCGPGCSHGGLHHGIQSFSFVIEQPVEWAAFAQWLEYVTALKGADFLRMKGLIHVADDPERPVVVHGVQHVFHPPRRLDAWPSGDRRTRLVFITRDIPRSAIERTLVRFAKVQPLPANRPVCEAA